MAKDLLTDSTFPDALYDVAFEEGEARGRQEGEEAMRQAVRSVLEARFGALDARLVHALERADATALKGLLAPAATESLEQIRAGLGAGE